MSKTSLKVVSKPTDRKPQSATKEEPAVAPEFTPTEESPEGPPPSKEAKSKKHGAKTQKPVRARFTFPASDYALVGSLKQRIGLAGCKAKKSEILRAGLIALATLGDTELLRVVGDVVNLRPDRPAK